MNHPCFITIEGVDGAGKSLHVANIVKSLKAMGYEVVHTREPGGTPLGEKLREIGLHDEMSLETETMLMFTSRKQHLSQVIVPALAAGKIVVCDRFTDSTWAYQHGAGGVDAAFVEKLESLTHGDLQPGATLLFDLPVEVSLERLKLTGKNPDKFEGQSKEFHAAVRNTYLQRAKDPRFSIIDSNQELSKVSEQVEKALVKHLPKIHHYLNLQSSSPSKMKPAY